MHKLKQHERTQHHPGRLTLWKYSSSLLSIGSDDDGKSSFLVNSSVTNESILCSECAKALWIYVRNCSQRILSAKETMCPRLTLLFSLRYKRSVSKPHHAFANRSVRHELLTLAIVSLVSVLRLHLFWLYLRPWLNLFYTDSNCVEAIIMPLI